MLLTFFLTSCTEKWRLWNDCVTEWGKRNVDRNETISTTRWMCRLFNSSHHWSSGWRTSRSLPLKSGKEADRGHHSALNGYWSRSINIFRCGAVTWTWFRLKLRASFQLALDHVLITSININEGNWFDVRASRVPGSVLGRHRAMETIRTTAIQV